MNLQDNVRAVVVKEVQLRDLVLMGALHCCSRASPSTSSPTFNCPLPRLRRPPADLNAATTTRTAIRAAAARRPTDYGARAHRPQRGQQPPTRTAIRAARRSSANGLWGQGQGCWHMSCGGIYCMRLASSGVGGVRRVRLAFGRHPMHPPHT